ncbi:MAG: ribonuclease P subunit p25 family protein [Promethearchaeota archaeon]
MVNKTTIVIRNRNDKDKSIKDAIFAFSGGEKSLMIKGEGDEISTAVEVAEILKSRMYPRLEIANVSLGSRPYFNNKQRGHNNRNFRNNKTKPEIVSNIRITLQTKSYT